MSNPEGIDARTRRRILDTVKALNEREAATSGDPEVTARIHAYEMAARMQTSVPELTDLSKEPTDVLEQYGAEPGDVQATVLHALGLDHPRLMTRYQGRDFRLTDVAGNVLKPLLA